jgi:hypothetical protein
MPEIQEIKAFDDSRLKRDFKLAYLLSMKKVESTLVLCVTATLLSLGFLFSQGNNSNYDLIYQFAHRYFWFALFAVYAFIKGVSVVSDISYRISTLNSIMGIWAWLYLFLSFAVFDKTPVAPTEAMLLVPVMAEAWLMLSFQHNKRRVL